MGDGVNKEKLGACRPDRRMASRSEERPVEAEMEKREQVQRKFRHKWNSVTKSHSF